MVDIDKYLNSIGTDDKIMPVLEPEEMNSMYNMLVLHHEHRMGEEYLPSESNYKIQNERMKLAELMRLRKLQ